MEPLEEVVCELEDEYSGPVIDALSLRRGEVILPPNMLSPCTCVSASCLFSPGQLSMSVLIARLPAVQSWAWSTSFFLASVLSTHLFQLYICVTHHVCIVLRHAKYEL